MKKIMNLCINEFIKLFKKKSTIILLLIAILAIIGSAGIAKMSEKSSMSYSDDSSRYEYMKYEIESLKKSLEQNFTNSDNTDNVKKEEIKIRIEMFQYAYDNKIDISYSNNWKSQLVQKIMSTKSELINAKNSSDGNDATKIAKIEADLNKIEYLLKNSDFEAYMDYSIENVNISYKYGNITKEEADEQTYILNLSKEYEIGKDEKSVNTWKSEVLDEISSIKSSLRQGFNTRTNTLLSFEDTQELNDTLKLDIYRLENDIPKTSQYYASVNYKKVYESMAEKLSMMFLGLFLIISAGSSISSEISKGTIKFWTMTPNKRWKILIAKLITYIIILLVGTILLSLISIVVGNIFFSDVSTHPYLYILNGNVTEIGNNIYQILRYLSYDIDILVYTLCATMLSVITRNTSVSTSVTLALYIGAETAMQIINTFVHAEWIKFIPFNSMNLTEKIFSNDSSLISMSSGMEQINITLEFSIVTLIVVAILMIVTMFDSFNNRDIN